MNTVIMYSSRYQKIVFTLSFLGLVLANSHSHAVKLNSPLTPLISNISSNPKVIAESPVLPGRNERILDFDQTNSQLITDLNEKLRRTSSETSYNNTILSIKDIKHAPGPLKLPSLRQNKLNSDKIIRFTETQPFLVDSMLPSSTKNWKKYAVHVQPDGRPMVAIVIDDLGVDKPRTQRAIDLPGPLTMSFLPYANQLKVQAERARLAGHEIWMHIPMEPSKESIDAGPKALLTGSSPLEIVKELSWSLDRLDKYVGINNHMGSRFTASLAEMHVVMGELHRRGIAFLDSVTSGQSQARLAAITSGVDFATRNIFIDHQNDRSTIRNQLSKLEAFAHKRGHAIGIAHPRDKTISALRLWLETLNEKGLMLVPVSALLNQN